MSGDNRTQNPDGEQGTDQALAQIQHSEARQEKPDPGLGRKAALVADPKNRPAEGGEASAPAGKPPERKSL